MSMPRSIHRTLPLNVPPMRGVPTQRPCFPQGSHHTIDATQDLVSMELALPEMIVQQTAWSSSPEVCVCFPPVHDFVCWNCSWSYEHVLSVIGLVDGVPHVRCVGIAGVAV